MLGWDCPEDGEQPFLDLYWISQHLVTLATLSLSLLLWDIPILDHDISDRGV